MINGALPPTLQGLLMGISLLLYRKFWRRATMSILIALWCCTLGMLGLKHLSGASLRQYGEPSVDAHFSAHFQSGSDDRPVKSIAQVSGHVKLGLFPSEIGHGKASAVAPEVEHNNASASAEWRIHWGYRDFKPKHARDLEPHAPAHHEFTKIGPHVDSNGPAGEHTTTGGAGESVRSGWGAESVYERGLLERSHMGGDQAGAHAIYGIVKAGPAKGAATSLGKSENTGLGEVVTKGSGQHTKEGNGKDLHGGHGQVDVNPGQGKNEPCDCLADPELSAVRSIAAMWLPRNASTACRKRCASIKFRCENCSAVEAHGSEADRADCWLMCRVHGSCPMQVPLRPEQLTPCPAYDPSLREERLALLRSLGGEISAVGEHPGIEVRGITPKSPELLSNQHFWCALRYLVYDYYMVIFKDQGDTHCDLDYQMCTAIADRQLATQYLPDTIKNRVVLMSNHPLLGYNSLSASDWHFDGRTEVSFCGGPLGCGMGAGNCTAPGAA
eukprot:jgi/Mesvir1/24781/Mv22034-RA.2